MYTTNENGEVLDQQRPLIEFSTTPRFLQQPIQEILPTTLRSTGNAQRFNVNYDRPVQSALQGTTKPPVSFDFNLKFSLYYLESYSEEILVSRQVFNNCFLFFFVRSKFIK